MRSTALAFVMLAAAMPVRAQDGAAPPLPIVVTGGEAIVSRPPDRAFVTAGVETRAKSPRDAQAQNATAMAAVQARLASAGVAKDALRTLGYTIQQEFDFVNGRRVPREYVARNSIEVRLDVLERVGDVIDAAVQAGATSIANVRFDLKDRAAAEREALRLAVVDARARADAAAAGAGRTIDRVLKIEDARQPPPGPRPMMMEARAAGIAPAETPVEPGTIEIRAQVTLTAVLK